jgi:hypothetical protein
MPTPAKIVVFAMGLWTAHGAKTGADTDIIDDTVRLIQYFNWKCVIGWMPATATITMLTLAPWPA